MFSRHNRPPSRNKTRLGIETLEDRRMMALTGLATSPVRLPADNAGGTPATAQVVALDLMEQASVSDHLANASDLDVYRVSLKQGDFLAADLDATGSSPLSATMAIVDSQARQLAFSRFGTEPESNFFRREPALGFYAPADDDYFVELKTSAATTSVGRSYQLDLERIGVDDMNHSAGDLAEDGKFHAWLSGDGSALHIAGPSGYGLTLEGDWTKGVSAQTVKYQVDGAVTLRTTYVDGSVGGLPLVTGSDGFSVKVSAPGWHQLGELKSTSGGLGFSLGILTEDIDRVLGINLDEVAVGAKWTIMTGSQVRAAFPQHKVQQVLDGVPYLVYGDTGRMAAEFGSLRVTTGNSESVLLIADPADPFLYAGYKDYAVAGSLEGRIPFNAAVTMPGSNLDLSWLGHSSARAVTDAYFGHLYLHGEAPLASFPVPVIGDLGFTGDAGVTVDLDANGDGAFLGGAATVEDLESGNISALETVLHDMNFAVNGEVNVGFSFAGYTVELPLGTASVYYSGPEQGIAFEGIQGMGADAWNGTPLEDFRSDTEIKVHGYAFRDGRFSVTSESRYYLLGNYADLGITVRSDGTVDSTEMAVAGTLHTWIGDASISGTVGLNGDYELAGSMSLDIGNSDNYIRGAGRCTLRRTGSTTSLTIETVPGDDFEAQVKIDNVAKASGKVSGRLAITVNADGQLNYSTDFHFSGSLYLWNPAKNNFKGGWSKVGSASGGFGISSGKLRLELSGHHFAIDLP